MSQPGAIADLRDRLARAGVVTVGSDAGDPYEALRPNFNRRLRSRPALIVLPRDVAGAALALRCLVERGTPFRIRSGGHCNEDWSLPSEDGALIDMRRFGDIEIRRAADGEMRVVAGVGARVGDVMAELEPLGLTLPSGLCPDVGIGGVTLGGGIGVLTRSHGLMADRVVAMEVVLASGEVVELDARAEEHDDLLWALRGAGNGNFALVTHITFDPVSLPEVVLYETWWPLDAMATVLDVWHRWAPHAPDGLASSFAEVFGASKGFMVAGLIVPDDRDARASDERAAKQVLRPFLDCVAPWKPHSMTVERTTSAGAVRHFCRDVPDSIAYKNRGTWTGKPLPAAAFEAIDAALRAMPSEAHGDVHVELVCMGGAVSRAPDGAAAFANRDAELMLELCSWWSPEMPDLECDRVQWVRALHGKLEPFLLAGAGYVNSPDNEIEDPERSYYGFNLGRLKQIKRRYDPGNVFSHPGSVRPEQGAANDDY
jgi:FAD/FMN-containing dehydrogenase